MKATHVKEGSLDSNGGKASNKKSRKQPLKASIPTPYLTVKDEKGGENGRKKGEGK